MDLLAPTETESHCPYKGTAQYWSLQVGGRVLPDVVWGYQAPFAEARSLAGIVCFWPEKSADIELSVDGRRVGEPNGVGPLR